MGLEDVFGDLGGGGGATPEIDGTRVSWVPGAGHMLDPFWQDQEADGLCGPTAVAIAIGALTGDPVDKDFVAQTAMDLGFLTANGDGTFSGMTPQDIEHLADHLGIDSDLTNGSLPELRQRLAAGEQVVVAVDGDELWYQRSDDLSADDAGMDHVVTLIGFDDESGTVILSDPGNGAAGQAYEMPLAAFEDAWADSDHEMVVMEPPGTPPAPAAPEATVPPAAPAAPEPPAQPAAPATPDAGERSGRGGLSASAVVPALITVPLMIVGHVIQRKRMNNRPGRAGGRS